MCTSPHSDRSSRRGWPARRNAGSWTPMCSCKTLCLGWKKKGRSEVTISCRWYSVFSATSVMRWSQSSKRKVGLQKKKACCLTKQALIGERDRGGGGGGRLGNRTALMGVRVTEQIISLWARFALVSYLLTALFKILLKSFKHFLTSLEVFIFREMTEIK